MKVKTQLRVTLVLLISSISTSSIAATAAASSTPTWVRPTAPTGRIVARFHSAVARSLLSITLAEITVAIPVAVSTAHLVTITASVAVLAVVAGTVTVTAVLVAVVAKVTPSSAATKAASPAHSSASPAAAAATCRLHLLLGERFLHLHLVSADGVELHHNGFVGRIVVVEVNKAEAALLPGVFVGDDLRFLDGPEL